MFVYDLLFDTCFVSRQGQQLWIKIMIPNFDKVTSLVWNRNPAWKCLESIHQFYPCFPQLNHYIYSTGQVNTIQLICIQFSLSVMPIIKMCAQFLTEYHIMLEGCKKSKNSSSTIFSSTLHIWKLVHHYSTNWFKFVNIISSFVILRLIAFSYCLMLQTAVYTRIQEKKKQDALIIEIHILLTTSFYTVNIIFIQ